MLLCIWGEKLGIEVLGRWSEFFIIMSIVLIVSITVILSLPQMKLENITPVLYDGIRPVLISGFLAFSFPFAEPVVFMMLFSSLKNKKSPFKVYFTGLI